MSAWPVLHFAAVEFGEPGDYRSMLAALGKAGLHPQNEIREQWRAL